MTTINFNLYNVGSTLVPDGEMVGCFKEKKKKSERKREKKQARAMAIRQAKARCAAITNINWNLLAKWGAAQTRERFYDICPEQYAT